MKLSKSMINMILFIAGIALGVCSWLYIAAPNLDKAKALETENATLKTQVDMYEAVNANLEQYKAEMEEMEKNIATIGNSYPANIIREDEIMYLVNMENALPDDLRIQSMEMASFLEVETDKAGAAVEGAEIVHLYQQPTAYLFKATYDGLKDMVTYLAESGNKKAIDVMDIERDNDTGQLKGTFVLNQYYMTGLDKEYQQLRIPTLQKGTANVFHTIDGVGIFSSDNTIDEDTENAEGETEETEEE